MQTSDVEGKLLLYVWLQEVHLRWYYRRVVWLNVYNHSINIEIQTQCRSVLLVGSSVSGKLVRVFLWLRFSSTIAELVILVYSNSPQLCDGVSLPPSSFCIHLDGLVSAQTNYNNHRYSDLEEEDARVVCTKCGFNSDQKNSELLSVANTALVLAGEVDRSSSFISCIIDGSTLTSNRTKSGAEGDIGWRHRRWNASESETKADESPRTSKRLFLWDIYHRYVDGD